jgi:hypothetical protein
MLDRTLLILVPILALPFLACLAILLIVPGIERSLLWSGIGHGVVLFAAAAALSYGASMLDARSKQREP